jgi:hypothetical protein
LLLAGKREAKSNKKNLMYAMLLCLWNGDTDTNLASNDGAGANKRDRGKRFRRKNRSELASSTGVGEPEKGSVASPLKMMPVLYVTCMPVKCGLVMPWESLTVEGASASPPVNLVARRELKSELHWMQS